METFKFVCIECPRGCALSVEKEGDEVRVFGNFCPKGKKYATDEVTVPKRIITSTVRAKDGMIPVKTDTSVKKAEMFNIMKKIRSVRVDKTLSIGDIVIENIDGEGANLIATAPYIAK